MESSDFFILEGKMDEMRFESNFMRSIISKLISRAIKKTGINIEINIKGLEIHTRGDKLYFDICCDGSVPIEELERQFI